MKDKLGFMEEQFKAQCEIMDRLRWREFQRKSLQMAFISIIATAIICFFVK
jgi:hypothetical protein